MPHDPFLFPARTVHVAVVAAELTVVDGLILECPLAVSELSSFVDGGDSDRTVRTWNKQAGAVGTGDDRLVVQLQIFGLADLAQPRHIEARQGRRHGGHLLGEQHEVLHLEQSALVCLHPSLARSRSRSLCRPLAYLSPACVG